MGFYEDDPTGYGLAASFGHPAGNVTGLAAMAVETVSKPLDLARAILPDLNRLGVLVNPILGSFRTSLVNLRASAEKVGDSAGLGSAEAARYRDCIQCDGADKQFGRNYFDKRSILFR
jgi:hypothetical protein